MPSNYVLLNKQTLTASAASVVFSSIPQTGYTDLKIVASIRTDRVTGSVATVSMKLNSTTTSVYSSVELGGTGSGPDYGGWSSVAPTTLFVGRVSQATDTAKTFGSLEVYIPNYAGSTVKSAICESVQENNGTSAYAQLTSWLCADTSPITTLTFTPNSGTNFVANTEFSLYGLAAVGTTPVVSPFATGGDTVTNDGTYWYHAFLSSGTFAPAKTLICDTLVVAGGGGSLWGAGGAGGLRGLTSQSLLSTVIYSCTIGAGGTIAGATTGKGNNSSLIGGAISISATGGGKGGSGGAWAAGNGGSGGGGGNDSPYSGGTGNEGGYSPVEGYAGGTGTGTNGAGGGGATAAGSGKNGGAGSSAYSSWASATSTGSSSAYAGGGGGGAASSPGSAGTGGGGAGSTGQGAVGVANTGGGAGGGWGSGGNTGGSGIVIIRYPMV